MKVFKRITSIVVAIAMVATLITVTPTKTEAAVKIIYGKKLSLLVGESDTIRVKGKATFKSSNKKIATVSKKGKVKAKKVGTCKITVKVGSSSKKVPVTVKLDDVTISSAALTSTAATANAAKVTWKKVSGAEGYYVYYSTSSTSGFKKVTVKGAKTTSTTIKGLAAGKTTYFKVKAYAKSGKKTVTSSSYSKVKSVKTYKLVWSDEFNYTDKSKLLENWTYEEGHGLNGGWGNNEWQHYTTTGDNVSLTGSALVIQPKYETLVCTDGKTKDEYTSARMISKGKKQFKYGRIEFRAQVPSAQGTWAALWMLGQGNNWPRTGEIDIMETLTDTNTGLFALDRIPQTIHNEKFNGMSSSSGPKNRTTTVTGSTTGYHTYGIIWTTKTITFTIDNKATWVYDPSPYDANGDGTGIVSLWPYNDEFFLLMNVAIGGTLGGSKFVNGKVVSVNVNKEEVIGTKGQMKVDWVRVYQ